MRTRFAEAFVATFALGRGWGLLLASGWLIAACGESATETGKACAESNLIAQCPAGSDPVLGAQAASACSGKASGSYIKEEGSATGQCQGSGSCVVACHFASPCTCDVESATKDGVVCRACPDQACGDGKCTGTEKPSCKTGEPGCAECAIDCSPKCGDGACNGTESPTSCPEDCAKKCLPSEVDCLGTKLQKCASDGSGWVVDQDCSLLGDYKCDKATASCVPIAACGNGTCDIGETNQSCPQDCQQCAAGQISCETSPGVSQCVSAGEPAHCGTCSNNCTAKPHVQPSKVTCQTGLCVVPAGACSSGWADCDGDGANGCEQSLNANDNCGACGTTCLAGKECAGAQCVDCVTNGKLNCAGQCVPSDAKNCGACGVECKGGTCANGHCTSCTVSVGDLYGAQGMTLGAGSTGFEVTCPNMPSGTVSVSVSGTVLLAQGTSISVGFGLDASPWSSCTWANDVGEAMFEKTAPGSGNMGYNAAIASYPVSSGGTVTARICMGYCNGSLGSSNCTFSSASKMVITAN